MDPPGPRAPEGSAFVVAKADARLGPKLLDPPLEEHGFSLAVTDVPLEPQMPSTRARVLGSALICLEGAK